MKRLHDGDYRAPERITFGDYLLERWLPTKKAQLRLSTFSSYKNNIELHVLPRLGAIPLQKLQPEDLDTFYAHLLTDGDQMFRYRRHLHKEASVSGQLNHPHIVRLLDADIDADPPYLVLE